MTSLHGRFAQRERDRVMSAFRAGKADLLIATDVAARGLDIERVSHVINYNVPSAPEDYVHRIGRTGRLGRSGVAITLAVYSIEQSESLLLIGNRAALRLSGSRKHRSRRQCIYYACRT